MTHEIILELEHITFSYNKSDPVLKDLSIKIPHAKLIAIAGPNGSGKTTLIKHLNGLHKPKKGSVYFKGKPIDNLKHLTEHVGIVFQNPDEQIFFPDVEDDIAFGLRNLRVPEERIKERVQEVLDTLQINNLKGRNFFNLSFGEKKKVAFAGILAVSPDIMVLDEPLTNIDAWSRDNFIKTIMELKKHSTIILVTHDADLLRIVDEIHFLYGGEIVEVFTDYQEFEKRMFEIVPKKE
jgi:energy-coupling factor transporter ATP-binding protein EcfA2